MIYKLKDKNIDSLKAHILYFCANNSIQKEFYSDKGK